MSGAEGRSRLGPELAMALERLDGLIRAYEEEPDPTVRERAFALLESVDAVHRAGLRGLAALLAAADGALREQALADPAVRLLLEMYDLLPAEPPAPGGSFVPLEEIEIIAAPRSRWLPAASLADLPADGLLSVMLEGARVLLARVDGEVRAYQDATSASPLPVGFGRREGNTVVCPWHGCRFDLASGQRLDQPGQSLRRLPVEIVDGEIRVELTSRPLASTLSAESRA